VPQPKAHEILVKVAAAGVNRPDVLQRGGTTGAPDGFRPAGLEVAGEVVAKGSAATLWKVGDRVCALVHGGAMPSTARCLKCRRCRSEGLSLIEAASLPRPASPSGGTSTTARSSPPRIAPRAGWHFRNRRDCDPDGGRHRQPRVRHRRLRREVRGVRAPRRRKGVQLPRPGLRRRSPGGDRRQGRQRILDMWPAITCRAS